MANKVVVDCSQTVDPVDFRGGKSKGLGSLGFLELDDGVIGFEEKFVFLGGDLDIRRVGVSQEGLDGGVGGGIDDRDVGTGLGH